MLSVILPFLLSMPAQQSDLNVAAASNGGTVFASSEYTGSEHDTGGGAPASRLIDGIILKKGEFPGNNRWHSALSVPHPHWITFTFARSAKIHSVQLYRSDIGSPVNIIGQWSPDHGKTIHTIFTQKGLNLDKEHPSVQIDFPAVITDNLRITITKSDNKEFPNYCQLSEVQIQGSFVGSKTVQSETKRTMGAMVDAPMPEGLSCQTSDNEITYESPWLKIVFPKDRPGITFFSIDSKGTSRHDRNFLATERGVDLNVIAWDRQYNSANVSFTLTRTGNVIRYSNIGGPKAGLGDLTFTVGAKGLKIAYDDSLSGHFEGSPLRALFNVHQVATTPLGRIRKSSLLEFPVMLHFPDRGTLLARCTEDGKTKKTKATWKFTSTRATGRVEFQLQPGKGVSHTEIDLQSAEVYPEKAIVDADPRLEGVKQGWLNGFGFRADVPCLSNNVVSDPVIFAMYFYADQAFYTPPLFDDFTALDMVRDSLEYYFRTPGTLGSDSNIMQDTDPAMVISSWDYVAGKNDLKWLKKNLKNIEKYADHIVACDRDKDGLPESTRSGISGKGVEGAGEWSSNWWDVVSFGHNDAYTIALDYRAFRCMVDLETRCGNKARAKFFAEKAKRIKDLYYKTFYNPSTGILGGWRSADGVLHDYWFTFVNGIAISYGLVTPAQGNAIMDRMLAKMKEVGYTNFKFGMPGNLVPVDLKDYAGGGVLGQPHVADGSDSFQSYENGGATAAYVYYTVQALYSLGRKSDADRIFYGLLEGYRDGLFQNGVGSGVDWKKWDGTPCGYEGLLTDCYYSLTAFITGKLGRGVPIP